LSVEDSHQSEQSKIFSISLNVSATGKVVGLVLFLNTSQFWVAATPLSEKL